jgi:hypothetical protein
MRFLLICVAVMGICKLLLCLVGIVDCKTPITDILLVIICIFWYVALKPKIVKVCVYTWLDNEKTVDVHWSNGDLSNGSVKEMQSLLDRANREGVEIVEKP